MATPTGPIRTQVDIELQDVMRGPELAGAVGANQRARSPMALPATYSPTDGAQDEALVLTWGDMQVRHPEWRGDYWGECRALYAGGDRLFTESKVLERLFPAHLYEEASVYRARKDRAHYFPYPGTIIDHLLAGLGTDPLCVSFSEVDDKGATTMPAAAKWWAQWVTDVTDEAEQPGDYGLEDRDGADQDDEGGCTIHHFLVDALREALQTRTAWVLADLPELDPDYAASLQITSQLDAERAAESAGLRDPYLCIVPAEQVIDWQHDDRGRLQWVLILAVTQPRSSPRDRRKMLLHTYTLWTAERWIRYQVLFDPANPPHETARYSPVAGGEHSFGRVPIERLILPEGMYAMGKLHSLAREHFNKRCAMSWAEYKSLFAILYEFHGPEEKNGLPVAMAQMDEGRATNQLRGQGYTQVRGQDDRAEFVGPPVDPFVAARDSCNDTMREMHRVMFSMAMSANMDTAAVRRSADSKKSDSSTTEVLLDAFGTILRRFCRRLLVLAALGRGEPVPAAHVTGYEKFNVTGIDTKIKQAVDLFAGVPMLSPLIKELYLARFYSDLVGDLTPEQMETVREQIREGISLEELAAQAQAGMGSGSDGNSPRGDDDPDDDEDGDGPGDEPPPRRAASGRTVQPMTMRRRAAG